MSTLSGLITPTNVLTADSTATLTNKTVGFSTNTFVGALAPANGGTGLTASGTLGNVLTSDGTAWVSSAPGSGGAQGFVTQYQGPSAAPTMNSFSIALI
jgi:ribosomal protein S5